MPPDARVPVGVQAVVERDGWRLMILRGAPQWYADGRGTWAHPGGWLDFGEDPLAAAARETLEETTVEVVGRSLIGCTTNYNTEQSLWIVTLIVGCEYVDGDPEVVEPEKCPEVAWVPVGEVDSLPLFRPTRAYQQKTYLAV